MTESVSRHLVDPQLAPLLDTFQSLQLSEAMLPQMRAAPPRFEPDPALADRVDMTVRAIAGPKDAPDVEVVVYTPRRATGPLPCILHVHGGGYITGSAAMMEARHRPLAADLGCCIVSINYRLAPETRFPGAVEDCYAALAWLCAHAAELGVDRDRIGVMGESAGGGLAAALALLARDRGEFPLSFQHLIYPMIDDRTCVAATPNPYVGEFVWTPQANRFGWSSLLGVEPGCDGVSPYAAAARADDLRGLPRTFIATGALDLFAEENLDYARRLLRAGVPVAFHIYPGAYHGFQWVMDADVTVQANRDSRDALARALTGPR